MISRDSEKDWMVRMFGRTIGILNMFGLLGERLGKWVCLGFWNYWDLEDVWDFENCWDVEDVNTCRHLVGILSAGTACKGWVGMNLDITYSS